MAETEVHFLKQNCPSSRSYFVLILGHSFLFKVSQLSSRIGVTYALCFCFSYLVVRWVLVFGNRSGLSNLLGNRNSISNPYKKGPMLKEFCALFFPFGYVLISLALALKQARRNLGGEPLEDWGGSERRRALLLSPPPQSSPSSLRSPLAIHQSRPKSRVRPKWRASSQAMLPMLALSYTWLLRV